MPALNTTQGHSRVNVATIHYLHRTHVDTHELVPHCTPQEQEPTLIDHVRDIAALAIVVGLSGLLWVVCGRPGLHYIGN